MCDPLGVLTGDECQPTLPNSEMFFGPEEDLMVQFLGA